jgi:hypothetical protein
MNDLKAIVFMPDCGKWGCSYCAQQMAFRWQLNAFKGATAYLAQGIPMAFITLTSRGGAGRSVDTALQTFAVGWPRLRKKALYANGQFEYVLIPEQHKNGILHCHLIATNQLTQRWWKDNAFKSGMGYMSKVLALSDSGLVPQYVAKYLGKDFVRVQWPKGFRRVRTSKNWPKLPEVSFPLPYEYEVFRDTGAVWWEIHLLRDLGYDVTISDSAGLD